MFSLTNYFVILISLMFNNFSNLGNVKKIALTPYFKNGYVHSWINIFVAHGPKKNPPPPNQILK